MKISHNSEENGRPEKRILSNKKKKTRFQLEQSLAGGGEGVHIVNDSTFELCSAYQ
jgi:hypothetical protein